MYLETERMILREFAMDDLQDLHEIFGDPVVMENTEPPYDLEQTESFLRGICTGCEPKGGFAAACKGTGKVIGYVLFKSIDEPEIYEIGWVFNRDYWRKGYAFEICSRLINHGFYEMELHKIYAEATDLDKSVALMEKLGMKPEGVWRKHSKYGDTDWRDLHWYAILAEDYLLV